MTFDEVFKVQGQGVWYENRLPCISHAGRQIRMMFRSCAVKRFHKTQVL
jgi:hypothetical protein